jgi:hypothetical protein
LCGKILYGLAAAATTVCLPADCRRLNLGESDDDARRAYDGCEPQRAALKRQS